MPLHKYKREEVRGLLCASQVNSWTVEYLASMKYEAQLAFKRKSSPGASGRSQPARPWSVARQEPCVKAEGLCHCVQMFSPALLAASTHSLSHRKQKPWRKDDSTFNTDAFTKHTCTRAHLRHRHIPSPYPVCTTTSLSCVLHSNKHLSGTLTWCGWKQ